MSSAAQKITIYLLAVAGTVLASSAPGAAAAPRPNIVFILADDLGYGDLSSYGATDIDTPNLDRLAREGVRFTQFYSAANTCSPSRAALMTGRYPPRSGVNAVLFHDTPEGLPQSELTIPELLRDAGYRTAMIGKWHLGNTDEFMPWNHGFDEFFGVPHSNDEKNFFLFDNRHRLPETVDQTQLIRRYTDRALEFLGRAVRPNEPFFLYLAYNAPHVPLYPSAGFSGRSRHGTYGDVVEELDASVGEVLRKLVHLGIDRETLVIFTSDNGPWLAMHDWGGSAGILRGGKTSTFEGGHRVPAMARWPGAVPPGEEARGVANMMDWLPTLIELAGARLPEDRPLDGRSLVDVLRAAANARPRRSSISACALPSAINTTGSTRCASIAGSSSSRSAVTRACSSRSPEPSCTGTVSCSSISRTTPANSTTWPPSTPTSWRASRRRSSRSRPRSPPPHRCGSPRRRTTTPAGRSSGAAWGSPPACRSARWGSSSSPPSARSAACDGAAGRSIRSDEDLRHPAMLFSWCWMRTAGKIHAIVPFATKGEGSMVGMSPRGSDASCRERREAGTTSPTRRGRGA